MNASAADHTHVQLIQTAYIVIPGDAFAGIPEQTITVSDLNVDLLCFGEQDRPGHLEEVRGKLAELGELVGAAKARVMFDFEIS